MTNAINIIPCRTDSCPTMGDYAIMKKMNRSWKDRKKGDIVLFDFNGNGTSDHIGIVVSVNKNGTITTVEGNTGSGKNTNGGQVQKRTRYRNQVNYFVRPNYNDEVTADMVIATALSQLGIKEKPMNSNKVKYNVWFYGKNISALWCCTFVCWVFAHVGIEKETTKKSKYNGTLPDLVQHGRERIVQVALELSYPIGTPARKYKYGVGKPKPQYKKALNDVYPDRSSWSAQCRAGASCDVGAGTILRYAGIDKTISRALSKQIPHIQKSDIWKKTGIKSSKKMKAGDVGIYTHYGPGGHIWISIGHGKIVEANHTAKYFLHVDSDRITSKGMKVWGVYRSQKVKALRKGDKTKQVKRLKKFLNWYGGYNLKLSNVFGNPTEKAVKDFQRRNGLKPDGVFGSAELKKAKAVSK